MITPSKMLMQNQKKLIFKESNYSCRTQNDKLAKYSSYIYFFKTYFAVLNSLSADFQLHRLGRPPSSRLFHIRKSTQNRPLDGRVRTDIVACQPGEKVIKFPPKSQNLNKIKMFQAAIRKYFGKTNFLGSKNELFLQEKIKFSKIVLLLKFFRLVRLCGPTCLFVLVQSFGMRRKCFFQ